MCHKFDLKLILQIPQNENWAYLGRKVKTYSESEYQINEIAANPKNE